MANLQFPVSPRDGGEYPFNLASLMTIVMVVMMNDDVDDDDDDGGEYPFTLACFLLIVRPTFSIK